MPGVLLFPAAVHFLGRPVDPVARTAPAAGQAGEAAFRQQVDQVAGGSGLADLGHGLVLGGADAFVELPRSVSRLGALFGSYTEPTVRAIRLSVRSGGLRSQGMRGKGRRDSRTQVARPPRRVRTSARRRPWRCASR